MIVIIDYGVGNIFSIENALNYLKLPCKISQDIGEIEQADGLILPGVGAFQDAMRNLEATGLIPTLKQVVAQGKPLLGICLGMQLLYTKSFEYGEYKGLDLITGDIIDMHQTFDPSTKIPHMGWNNLIVGKDAPILEDIPTNASVYFVHSYYVQSEGSECVANAVYDQVIPAIIQQDNLYGMQFHPEKSGEIGLQLLANFGKVCTV